MGVCCKSQGTQTGALSQPRGVGWEGDGGSFKRKGAYGHLWLIHVDVCQTTTKFCKQLSFN